MPERTTPSAARTTAAAPAPSDNPFAVLIPPDAGRRAEPVEPPPGPSPAGTAMLVLASGVRVPIDGPIVLGRNPQAASEQDRLVVLDNAGAQVSRTHARLRIEAGRLVLDDLGSRNGTGLTPPGQPRRRVAPGGTADVPIGSVIDFGARVEATIAPA